MKICAKIVSILITSSCLVFASGCEQENVQRHETSRQHLKEFERELHRATEDAVRKVEEDFHKENPYIGPTNVDF